MTYYLANLEFGDDHAIKATYRVLSMTLKLTGECGHDHHQGKRMEALDKEKL